MEFEKEPVGEEERHNRDSASSEWPCGQRNCPFNACGK